MGLNAEANGSRGIAVPSAATAARPEASTLSQLGTDELNAAVPRGRLLMLFLALLPLPAPPWMEFRERAKEDGGGSDRAEPVAFLFEAVCEGAMIICVPRPRRWPGDWTKLEHLPIALPNDLSSLVSSARA
mmetsp:Transcript_22621/g.48692  ORF Transcript_22621/g.48692 Transcript_22621/m.48692 type:complete len:131 (+) Transcript_22621:3-395(+)